MPFSDKVAHADGAARRLRRSTSPGGARNEGARRQCERNGGGIAPNWDLVSIAQLLERLHQIEHNLASNPYGERAAVARQSSSFLHSYTSSSAT